MCRVLAKPLGMGAPRDKRAFGPSGSRTRGARVRSLLAERGAQLPLPPARGASGERGAPGLLLRLHPGAQRVRSPRGEPRLHPSVLSAGLRGGSWRGADDRLPQPFLWLRPPAPSKPGREAQRLLDRVQTDRPFGRMPQQRIPTVNTWERRGKSPCPHPRSSGSALPAHPPASLTTLSSPVLPPSVLAAWVPPAPPLLPSLLRTPS